MLSCISETFQKWTVYSTRLVNNKGANRVLGLGEDILPMTILRIVHDIQGMVKLRTPWLAKRSIFDVMIRTKGVCHFIGLVLRFLFLYPEIR